MRKVPLVFFLFCLCFIISAAPAFAQTLTVAGWEIESGRSQDSAVAARIRCPANYTENLVNPNQRIVKADFKMSGRVSTREDLLRRIEEIERQLIELKNAVRNLPNN